MKTITVKLSGLVLCFALLLMTSCKKDFFDTEERGVVSKDQVDDIAESSPDAVKKVVEPLLAGIYSDLFKYDWAGGSSADHNRFGWMSIMHLGDVMNDDMAFHSAGNGWYTFDYQLDYWGQQYVRPRYYWEFFYTRINTANSILEKIPATTTDPDLKAYRGQSLAIRAISHAYLCQMFQLTYIGHEDMPGVPIILAAGEEGGALNRAPLRQVYAQVEKDFKEAIPLLEGYVRPSKAYIDQNVAAGLYARVCLVTNNWEDAITYSRMARTGYGFYTAAQLPSIGFNDANETEWMWGSIIDATTQTAYASFFSFICSSDAGYGGDVGGFRKIDKRLYDALPTTDARRALFNQNPNQTTASGGAKIPLYANVKFKRLEGWTADYVYMRSAEMVLIEAEALAHQGNGSSAAAALKTLMTNRDPAWNVGNVTVDDVYYQRRVELWGEGFSLFDHLRLNKGIDRRNSNHLAGMEYVIPGGSRYFLYQIPLSELDNNSEMTTADQNPTPDGSKFQF